MLQKQGNTEAVPVGRKSVGVTFTSYPKYITIFNNSQYIKNIDILLFIETEKEPRSTSSSHTRDYYLSEGEANSPSRPCRPSKHIHYELYHCQVKMR
jgi:hypothetical protein